MTWPTGNGSRGGGGGDLGTWWGVIHGVPDGGTVDVLIPGLHPSKPYGAFLQDPRPDDPSPGDRCLIVFDNDDDPWVVVTSAAA
jgi:hypothetical protein